MYVALLTIFACLIPEQFALADGFPYSTTPDWESGIGYCGTGLAFTDINNDGYQDMVVSNGNDIAKQQLFVYYNDTTGHFNTAPDWTSDDYAFNGNLAVGDINKDGYIDVAVSVYLGPDHTYDGGGVKVYFNNGESPPSLEKTPSWSIDGFPSFHVALGDANADGYLDVAVAAGNPIAEAETFAAQPDCRQPPSFQSVSLPDADAPPPTPHMSTASIYAFTPVNHSFEQIWTQENQVSMDVLFGDVNKDGDIDLILGNPVTTVYLGHASGIAETPGWQTTQEDYFANSLDFAASLDLNADNPKARVASIMISNNNYMGGGHGRFNLFRFTSSYIIDFNPHTSSPSWSSPKGGWGSGVLLADVNSDGFVDLLAGRWAPPGSGVLQAPLEIYQGDGMMFEDSPAFISDPAAWSVAEIIAVADLDNGNLQTLYQQTTVPDSESWNIITLNRQNIHAIIHVFVNGILLTPLKDYVTVPGRNVLYLTNPVNPDDEVTVMALYSEQLDIGVTNWDCSIGNYIFYWKSQLLP
jgi:hypothetical protein